MRVQRPQLRSLNLAFELEPAEVDVGIFGDTSLLTQEPGLLGEVLNLSTERVGLSHGILHGLVRRANLHAELLEVPHRFG